MGYHIILNQNKQGLEHYYVEDIEDLATFKIQPSSIIYEGEVHWSPLMAKNDETYNQYTQDWYRAGIKAQKLFKEQALQHKYIIEELSQDKNSFKQYYNISKEFIKVKRGDFILRNAGN